MIILYDDNNIIKIPKIIVQMSQFFPNFYDIFYGVGKTILIAQKVAKIRRFWINQNFKIFFTTIEIVIANGKHSS